jgi:alkylation response protein AidB-like acyl-CoA dehydrogenase
VAARGYLTMAWPREYGGRDLPLMHQVVFQEEQAMARAPHRDLSTSINIVAPTVMVHGTDEQKQRFLPPIGRGEHVYCQGFSEPGVGSDLASLQCSAVRDGDEYIVNGSKSWTSGAHRSTHCILLTRTDPAAPKHKGISMFLVPIDTPGITVRPIRDPNGLHYFNEVFFDNVRISASDRIGEENQGWYVTTTTLDFERSGIYRFAFNQRNLDEIHELARETSWRGSSAAGNPAVRHALADQMVGNHAGRLLAYRVAWMQSQGMVPNQEASTAKLWGSELSQTISQLGMRLLGLYGQIDRGSKFAVLEGHIKADYVNSVSRTVRGGTSEIQRNIIATRGLRLPRG